MAINRFNPNTGKRLRPGETVNFNGGTVTEGTRFEAPGNPDNVPIRNDRVAVVRGDYGQKAQEQIVQQDFNNSGNQGSFRSYQPPKLTSAESASFAGQFGSSVKEFAGLTMEQAQSKVEEKKKALGGQQSALTSYTFNPQVIAGFNDKLKQARLGIDNINGDAFFNRNEKRDKVQNTIDSYSTQFAGLFNTSQDFDMALQNPDFQNSLRQYERLGGTISSITSKIAQPSTITPDGVASPFQQDMMGYLGALKTPADQQAFDVLVPEKKVYQDQIALQQSIPEQQRSLYFGTPEQIGLVQQRRDQAMEQIKLIERKEKLDRQNIRAQVDFATEKNDAELTIELETTEENRLNAKNYMTGMLAKLGALNTTGAAPQAIATLEQKYQAQSQKLRTSYNFANREIRMNLNEKIDGLSIQRDQDILNVKENISKSEEQVWKEIFKLQNTADEKSLSIIQTYTQEFRVQREKFAKEAKAEAEKNAKAFARLASSYNVGSVSRNVQEGDISITRTKKGGIKNANVLNPGGNLGSIESALEASKGSDGHVSSRVYQDLFDKFLNAGGTRSEFLKKFPPKEYTNPKDTTLPSFLRFGSSTRSEAESDGDDELDYDNM